ncbi:MAG: LysE family translocator [Xanthobacteraceae bacterium]|nr:LysE family translocator [Xanthobacteraceae bacterium]QYK44124.1 MAG: LysE family translocator [Xanthobacteraceae bacterium]
MAPVPALWQFPAALPEKLLAFTLFSLAGAITPGPNNTISTLSGATFGFRRTLPQMLGVSVGYPLMFAALGLGFGQVFVLVPWLHGAMRYAGAAFLFYLAWKLIRANAPEAAGTARPVGFVEAFFFQWLNPKAWSIALGALAAFTSPGLETGAFLREVAVYTAVSVLITFPSLVLWCLFGVAIARLLKDERKRRIFNYSLAAVLVLSVAFLFV